MSWSWTALLRAHGGDEERALVELERMPWVGEYSDEVHLPSRSDVCLEPRPVVAQECPQGHRMARDGVENGRQRWRCKPCRWTARTPYVAANAAGGG